MDNYAALEGTFEMPAPENFDEEYQAWLDRLDNKHFLEMMDIELDGTFSAGEMTVVTTLLRAGGNTICWQNVRARLHAADYRWLGEYKVSRGLLLEKLDKLSA